MGRAVKCLTRVKYLERQIKEGLWVKADLERLEQVVDNLFSNAVKFHTPAKPFTCGQVQDATASCIWRFKTKDWA